MKPVDKTEVLSLPKPLDALVLKLKEILVLPHITKVEITPDDLSITRSVQDEEEVIPDKSFDKFLNPEVILLEKIELVDVLQDGSKHPLEVLREAFDIISAQNMQARWVMEPEAGLAAAYFGCEGHYVFGMEPVGISDTFDDTIVLVCGPTRYLSDATLGVIVSVM